MSIELKIDVNGGFTSDHQEGRVIVRGYFRNLGAEPVPVSASSIQYDVQGPGAAGVRNDAPYNNMDTLLLQPYGKYEFEAELTAYGNLEVGPIYRLRATLADGSDQDTSMFTFRQIYLGSGQPPQA